MLLPPRRPHPWDDGDIALVRADLSPAHGRLLAPIPGARFAWVVNDPDGPLVTTRESATIKGRRVGEKGGQAGVEEPDPRIIRAAAAGDLTAFEALVRAYQLPVWRFLRHLVTDAGLAEDCTQETFLRVHRSLGSFGFRSKFSTWVFAVARNVGIDALRARARRERLVAVLDPPVAVCDGSDRVEVAAAVASLPEGLREAFVLVEVVGLTYREAGEAAAAPEGTMKSRVFRAREQLVTWMRAGEQTDPAQRGGSQGGGHDRAL